MDIQSIINNPLYDSYKDYCTRGTGLDKKMMMNKEGRFATNEGTQALLVIKELLAEKCKNVLEIGVLHGGSMILMQNSKYISHFVGVDIFSYYGNKVDIHSNTVVTEENTRNNIIKYNVNGHTFDLINGDSTSTEVRKKLEKYDKFDFIYIDGDHSYEGCQNDFELADSLSHIGTIIIFDNYRCTGHNLQVKKAVHESRILSNYNIIGQLFDIFIIQKTSDVH